MSIDVNGLAAHALIANDLLAQALVELRLTVRGYLETGGDLVKDSAGNLVLDKNLNAASAIEGEGDLLELIRDIQDHLGGAPVSGPQWLDEVIAQGPAWAKGGAA